MGTSADPGVAAASGAPIRVLTRELTERLARSEAIAEPETEARDLLAALLDAPRSWPVLNRDVPIDDALRERALAAAVKRARGAPLAYCVGKAPFRHLVLTVDERVLIPRPETEQLVDVVIAAVGPAAGGIAIDVGTGSGAIALALATEAHFDRVVATDVSLDALAVARHNAEALVGGRRATVEFRHGSLLSPIADVRARLVVSNPPYVANREAVGLPSSVRDWEPPVALFSGSEGLHATARLVRQAAPRLEPGGVLALEVDFRRASAVADLAAGDARFRDVRVIKDLTARDRFVVARRKEDG
jgi:release factor glutamine methyltransferase